MSHGTVTMVRIYLTEGEALLQKLMSLLHDENKVSGVTVFRGISGFGRSGRYHSAKLLDMSMDLPLVVEFFDEPGKVKELLPKLTALVDAGHVVCWPAELPHQ